MMTKVFIVMIFLAPFSLMGQSTKLDYTSKGDSVFQVTQTTTLEPMNKEGFQVFFYNEIIRDYDKIAALQWDIIQIRRGISEKAGVIEKAGVNNYSFDVDTLLKTSIDGNWLYSGANNEQVVEVKEGKIWSGDTPVATVTHKSRLIKEINFNFFNMTTFVIMVSKDGNVFQGTDPDGKVHSLTRVAGTAIPTN